MQPLTAKGAVVTGPASGIGRAIAAAFIEAGSGVVLCDVNATALDAVAREFGDRAIGCITDVSEEAQVDAAMRAARDAFVSLDIVVNCAGFGALAPLTELGAEQWKSVHAVTLNGVSTLSIRVRGTCSNNNGRASSSTSRRSTANSRVRARWRIARRKQAWT
jgi:NADP-dependent 3-hydroxy acid dehydrogenase YdfG